MVKYFCDKCGTEYNPITDSYYKFDVGCYNGYWKVQHSEKEYNLCHDCYSKFINKFLNNNTNE